MKSFELPLAPLLALLLCSLAAGQVSQSAPAASPQLRFVAQLSVSGCALFVHHTGASDGLHLAVEPIMCVTDSLRNLTARCDPVMQQLYVSVPVLLRDDGMLPEISFRLRHLHPKSVSFATVTDLSVSTDANSSIRHLGLVWSSEAPEVAFLRLAFNNRSLTPINWISGDSPEEALNRVLLTASIKSNGMRRQLSYRPLMRDQRHFDLDVYRLESRYSLPTCQQLRFIRSVNHGNCMARVHQRLDVKGHFLIEPLLCHNITSLSSESVKYDYSRDMHYLKLDLVLQDDATLDAVRTQLADLSPRSVEFMRLWLAERSMSSALSARFEIGPLMVSGDWRSAQMRAFCGAWKRCDGLRLAVQSEPVHLWRHIKLQVTSLAIGNCLVESGPVRYCWGLRERKLASSFSGLPACLKICEHSNCNLQGLRKTVNNATFIIIQQRLSGNVSFQRTWSEYETGFGDDTDFWIGLSAIHSLSSGGATLRVEMKLWNGTELHAEYAGFQVGDASTEYVMTYREMLRDRSSVGFDALEHSKGMRFSTMDRDNDRHNGSCSQSFGSGGWWFNYCYSCNPNGNFPTRWNPDYGSMIWNSDSTWVSLREVRMMLQI